jgi:hypothetical protein
VKWFADDNHEAIAIFNDNDPDDPNYKPTLHKVNRFWGHAVGSKNVREQLGLYDPESIGLQRKIILSRMATLSQQEIIMQIWHRGSTLLVLGLLLHLQYRSAVKIKMLIGNRLSHNDSTMPMLQVRNAPLLTVFQHNSSVCLSRRIRKMQNARL